MAAEEDGKSSRQKLLDRLQRTLNTLDDEEQLEEAVRAVEKLVSDREARQASLIRQLAFYFSDANLRRDRFLREKIVASEQGFVPLSVILPFNRLKLMGCVTEGELAAAVQAADPKFNMELSEEKDAIRRAGGAEPPSLSFGGAGSDLEKRSVQLSGFPKGDELVTIEEVSKLCEPFGKVDFVRLLREGPSDDGKIFMGSAEVEFQSEEAAKAVVGLEQALCWKDKPLDAARLLSDLRREREAKRKLESSDWEEQREQKHKEKRRRMDEEAEEAARSMERGLVLRFDKVPSTVSWRDMKDGLRPYGIARFVRLEHSEAGSCALVQMRDDEGVSAVLSCAGEDDGHLCIQCWPSGPPQPKAGTLDEKDSDEELEDRTVDKDEEMSVAQVVEASVKEETPEVKEEKGKVEEEKEEKETAGKEVASDEDDGIQASVTIRLPVQKVSGEDEELFLKKVALQNLYAQDFKGKDKGKGKGSKGKGKGKDSKGKGKGKKGKKGKGKKSRDD